MIDPNASSTRPERCLFCNSTELFPWLSGVRDRLEFVAGEWGFLKCGRCGSAVLNPMPPADQLSSLYPPVYGPAPPPIGHGFAGFLARLPHRLFYQPQYDAQQRLVLRGIGWHGRQGLRYLDVGCGRGLRLAGFQKLGFHATGTDFVHEYTESVRQLGFECHTTGFDTLTDHIGAEQFDLVTAFHVFEHLPDPSLAARACWDVLAPGGWLVVAGPLVDSSQSVALGTKWIGFTEAPRHLSVPTAAGVGRLLADSGFVVGRTLPDALLNTAGMIALSAFPGLAAHQDRPATVAKAVVSAVATVLSLPFALAESYLWCRPAAGMVFARKPLQ